MSTRSLIGRENADGTVSGIYCHFDGYPDGVGATLSAHWTDPGKVDALLALGDVSVLGEELGEKHPFDSFLYTEEEKARFAGWTLAYGRDRGEDGTDADIYADAESFAASNSWAQFTYLFRDGAWLYRSRRSPADFAPVADALTARAA